MGVWPFQMAPSWILRLVLMVFFTRQEVMDAEKVLHKPKNEGRRFASMSLLHVQDLIQRFVKVWSSDAKDCQTFFTSSLGIGILGTI